MSLRVYVDAKILGRHDPKLPKRTLVGYVVENTEDLHEVTQVSADQTDEAEMEAVAFAIQDLKEKLEQFTVVSDNESVVSVIQRKDQRYAKRRPILLKILEAQEANPSIKVELLLNNPAHRLLNRYLVEHPELLDVP